MRKFGRLSIFVALLLVVFTVFPRNKVHAASVSTWAELKSAFASGGLGAIVTVQLTADIKAEPGDTALEVPSAKIITLDLNGHILDRGLTEATDNGNVIFVNQGGSLTIKDSNPSAEHNPAVTYTDPVKGETVTVTGGIITGANNHGGGGIITDGILIISGGTITGNTGSEGGGVRVYDNGIVQLRGGSISGNVANTYDGGGICSTGKVDIVSGTISGNNVTSDDPDGGGIYSTGTLTIQGGTISRNKSGWGAGLYNTGVLTIGGGTISENKAGETGGGLITGGSGTVEIKAGSIFNNEAKQGGGIQISGGTVTMTGGTISGNKALEVGSYTGGGGVKLKNSAVFIMEGGTISNNEAALDGGGVCTTATFRMSGGTISGNKAKYGGGVYVEFEKGKFEMSGGTISGNEGRFLAGGVYVQKTCKFTMTGGKIINNTVLELDNWHDGQGGGIFAYDGASLKISGGTISGNKAPHQGGGVYSWTQFELSGDPAITGNTVNDNADDVFLKIDQNINVSGTLTGTVGVKADDRSYVITSGLNGNGNASNFQSNVPGYSIGLNGDNEAIFEVIVYNIEIDTNISNGTVRSNKTTATIGETVTLSVTPATGYELDKLSVKKGNDEISVSGSNNRYTFEMPAGDVKVSATFKLKKFNVTWVIDGKEEYETYNFGAIPSYKNGTPGKEADAQYTYTFKEWTPALVSVTEDATYTAVFSSTVNKYTITFTDEDGTKLQSSQVPYGEIPAYSGETPTKAATAQYTYTFAGWTPEIVPVAGDAAYTATYRSTVNKYTVRFLNEDGTELQSDKLAYGEMPSYVGETPAKEATAQYTYTFADWTPEIVSVTGDATYTATYSSTVREYTVKFLNEDGTELQSDKLAYGEMPSYAGETPTKAATAQYTYTFAGWTPEIVSVTCDAAYTATYDSTVNEYTVSFLDEDGTELQSSKVPYGETPAYDGETPAKEATAQYTYTFSGWTPEIVKVTSDAAYTATYDSTVNEYTVSFLDEDGTELQNSKVPYGETPAYNGETPAKEATAQYTYTFSCWTPEIAKVTGDAAYTATYDSAVRKYTVRFLDEDGTELQSSQLPYGETPAYNGETPVKEADAQYTYTFSGWTPEIAPVTGDAAYTAVYSSEKIVPITYSVIQGANGRWRQGSADGFTLTVKRSEDDTNCFSHFTGVKIDGKALSAGDYAAKSGSTVITLKTAALEKLSVGTHTIIVSFDDGQAETKLTVQKATTAPDMGDNSHIGLWISLMSLSAFSLCGLAAYEKKRSCAAE